MACYRGGQAGGGGVGGGGGLAAGGGSIHPLGLFGLAMHESKKC